MDNRWNKTRVEDIGKMVIRDDKPESDSGKAPTAVCFFKSEGFFEKGSGEKENDEQID